MARPTLVAIITLAVIAALPGCGDRADPSLIVASGHVEATDVRIASKVGGRLEMLPFEELDRMQGLLDAGSGSVKARDDALTRRNVAARTLDAARESLHRFKAGFPGRRRSMPPAPGQRSPKQGSPS